MVYHEQKKLNIPSTIEPGETEGGTADEVVSYLISGENLKFYLRNSSFHQVEFLLNLMKVRDDLRIKILDYLIENIDLFKECMPVNVNGELNIHIVVKILECFDNDEQLLKILNILIPMSGYKLTYSDIKILSKLENIVPKYFSSLISYDSGLAHYAYLNKSDFIDLIVNSNILNKDYLLDFAIENNIILRLENIGDYNKLAKIFPEHAIFRCKSIDEVSKCYDNFKKEREQVKDVKNNAEIIKDMMLDRNSVFAQRPLPKDILIKISACTANQDSLDMTSAEHAARKVFNKI